MDMQLRQKKKIVQRKGIKMAFMPPCNDENVNIINIANNQYRNQKKKSAFDNSLQLCEILRP